MIIIWHVIVINNIIRKIKEKIIGKNHTKI